MQPVISPKPSTHPIRIGIALAIDHALAHLGRHDDAITEIGYARDAYSSASLLPQVAACDVDVSYTLRSLGRFEEAKDAVLRVQDAYREIGYDADDTWFD